MHWGSENREKENDKVSSSALNGCAESEKVEKLCAGKNWSFPCNILVPPV